MTTAPQEQEGGGQTDTTFAWHFDAAQLAEQVKQDPEEVVYLELSSFDSESDNEVAASESAARFAEPIDALLGVLGVTDQNSAEGFLEGRLFEHDGTHWSIDAVWIEALTRHETIGAVIFERISGMLTYGVDESGSSSSKIAFGTNNGLVVIVSANGEFYEERDERDDFLGFQTKISAEAIVMARERFDLQRDLLFPDDTIE